MTGHRFARAAAGVVAGAALIALAACQIEEGATGVETTRATGGEVVFGTFYEDRGGYCSVGFTVTYPADAPPHSRMIRTAEDASSFVGGEEAIPIPPLGPPDAFRRNADGTVTFGVILQTSADRCDPALTARTIAIGPCASGDCLPARFAPGPEAARLGMRSVRY
jgi:hypothetical protein